MDKLPIELFNYHILQYLDYDDIINLSGTCKYINNICKSADRWVDIFHLMFPLITKNVRQYSKIYNLSYMELFSRYYQCFKHNNPLNYAISLKYRDVVISLINLGITPLNNDTARLAYNNGMYDLFILAITGYPYWMYKNIFINNPDITYTYFDRLNNRMAHDYFKVILERRLYNLIPHLVSSVDKYFLLWLCVENINNDIVPYIINFINLTKDDLTIMVIKYIDILCSDINRWMYVFNMDSTELINTICYSINIPAIKYILSYADINNRPIDDFTRGIISIINNPTIKPVVNTEIFNRLIINPHDVQERIILNNIIYDMFDNYRNYFYRAILYKNRLFNINIPLDLAEDIYNIPIDDIIIGNISNYINNERIFDILLNIHNIDISDDLLDTIYNTKPEYIDKIAKRMIYNNLSLVNAEEELLNKMEFIKSLNPITEYNNLYIYLRTCLQKSLYNPIVNYLINNIGLAHILIETNNVFNINPINKFKVIRRMISYYNQTRYNYSTLLYYLFNNLYTDQSIRLFYRLHIINNRVDELLAIETSLAIKMLDKLICDADIINYVIRYCADIDRMIDLIKRYNKYYPLSCKLILDRVKELVDGDINIDIPNIRQNIVINQIHNEIFS